MCLHEGLTDSFSTNPNKQPNEVVSVCDAIQPRETMMLSTNVIFQSVFFWSTAPTPWQRLRSLYDDVNAGPEH